MFKLQEKFFLLFFLILFFNIAFAEDMMKKYSPDNNEDIYKNVFEINPTSDSCYVAYERVLYYTGEMFFQIDARNTVKKGDDFGRAGITFRYALTPDSVISSRMESAWIDGQNNLTLKCGFDSPAFGFSVTGVKSLSDPEVVYSEEVVNSSSSTYEDTLTGESDGYANYNRETTTTSQVTVTESRFATPDGILLDFNINLFKQFNFTFGSSYWEVDDWNEIGYHANLNWQITKGDAIGAHGAHIDGETEGGVYYRKSFSSFGDIFKPGEPISGSAPSMPLIQRLATVPYSTPNIKIMTAATYTEKKEEVKVEKETTEVKVKTNNPPKINSVGLINGTGSGSIHSIDATDSDGRIEKWEIFITPTPSFISGQTSGSWPFDHPIFISGSGLYTVTTRVTDNDGDSSSVTGVLSI